MAQLRAEEVIVNALKNCYLLSATFAVLATAAAIPGARNAAAYSCHTTEDRPGACCIRDLGQKYDAASKYYTVTWRNSCGYNVRVQYTRSDGSTHYETLRGRPNEEVETSSFPSVYQVTGWHELFD